MLDPVLLRNGRGGVHERKSPAWEGSLNSERSTIVGKKAKQQRHSGRGVERGNHRKGGSPETAVPVISTLVPAHGPLEKTNKRISITKIVSSFRLFNFPEHDVVQTKTYGMIVPNKRGIPNKVTILPVRSTTDPCSNAAN